MAAPQGAFLAAVLLLVSSLLLCSSSSPACPQSCTCGRAPLLNCSSAGLSSIPQHIRDSVTELDLSHNLLKSVTLHRPHHNLRSVWLGNNSIPHLSICIERNLEGQYLRDTHGSGPGNRQRCVSWAPSLQLLSVERNQLEQIPEGLEGIASLQVLHLSFNRISTLQPGDLSHLQQLKELQLQHNLITSLHPQTFQDLAQLKVLDLSFNMLTSLHPLMYLTLHNIGTDVRLLGNRWQCDCRMHSLRRRMAFDRNRGLQVWSVTCASPAVFSGRDLLHLQDDDLNCLSAANIPDLHQDVTVYSGSEILLSCSAEDSMWWTPSGETSLNQPEGGLLISDITERDTGLYVCVSEEKQVVSIFNLQISKIGGARRKPRSLSGTIQHIIQQGPSNRIAREINPRAESITQSHLALAVSLSIFITFLIAFILGVLARPCVDVFWKKVTKKKTSRETNTGVSVEQRQYDNEAFSNVEEPEVIEHHRERRVTFSTVDYREGSSVQYYDTVASSNQESINNAVVIECEATESKNIKHTAEDSGSESGSHQSNSEDKLNSGRHHTSPGHSYSMEFEPIPDPDELEERRSLSSSSSDSSLSEKEFKEDHTTPKSPKVTEDPVQQKADLSVATKVDGPQISTNSKNKMPSCTSEPWLPHADNRNSTDPGDLEENGELFEFSDSIQSPSPSSGSMFDSFKKSKITVASTSEKQKRDSVSSSSSHISEDEPTFYTVNPDQHDASFKKHAVRPDHSFSSDSSENDKEPDKQTNKPETDKDTRMKITPKPWTKWRGVYWDTSQSKTLDANESNLDKKKHLHMSIAPLEVSQTIGHNAETKWPDREQKTDMKLSSPASNSSSSSDSGDETGHIEKQKPGKLSIAPRQFQEAQTKHHQGVRAPSVDSDISSSSDSEEEIQRKQAQGSLHTPILPNRSSQKVSHEHEIRRPAIPPEHPRSIKKDSDMKEPSSASSSSSSSNSEDETHHKVQQSPGTLGISPRPFQESQTKSPVPTAKWPSIDLQHIPHIKHHLDIKAPSAGSNTSSSSDSEEEQEKDIHMPILPNRSSQKVRHEHETGGPAIPPEHPRSIKKDLDIKKPSSASSSSSSSDSEDETGHKVQQSAGKLGIAPHPFQESPDPNAKWPTIDLKHIPHIKRRLDIKGPSAGSHTSSSSDSEEDTPKKQEQGRVQMPILPSRSPPKISQEHEIRRPAIPPERPRSFKKSDSSSSSSSDSEDETHHKVQQSTGKLGIAPHPFQESPDPNAKWPTIDLKHIPHIKRRLDIKGPSAGSHTSSSCDSEKDTPKKQEQGRVQMPVLPNRSPPSHEHEIRRPAIPPECPRSFKKSDSSSSSSSDSEDEIHHKVQQSPGKLGIAPHPFQESPDLNAKWPTIDLKHIPHIKRHLDIKGPSAGSHTSSSSDSEEDTPKKQEQGRVQMPILPNRSPPSQKVSHEHEIRRPAIPTERPRSFKKSDSSSSSSSDSEDEIHHKVQQSPGKLGIAPYPFQESPDLNAKWPTIDLKHIPHIKRRLDIKGPSAGSRTSSSSDSEEDTPKKQEQGRVQMPILPSRSPPKISHEHEIRRPAIPPEHPRSFNISDSSSSSSSDSEDETHHKVQQSPGKLGIAPHPFQESPDPNAKWPTIDLKHIPHIKRRLDIKGPSAGSHTSSSCDSEKDTPKKQEQGRVQMPILPNRSPPSHEHEIRRPAIPPEHPRSFKKSDSSSSSSSDSEDEIHHKVQQSTGKLGIAPHPFQESPDLNAKWPTIDLKHIPHIKRRLDIKGPSAGSRTSSSSDSEEDTPKKQEQGRVQMPILPSRSPPKISHEHEIRRPAIPPEHPRSFNISDSSSSSSSDSEDETHHKVQQSPGKLGIAPHPFQESPDPNAKWPTIDLKHIPHIKRRLDIKGPSAGSHTSSSCDSEKDTPKKQEQGRVQMPILPNRSPPSHEHEIRRPAIPPEHPRSFKKSDSSSSSSSDSEDEIHHKVQQSTGKLGIAPHPFQESPDLNAKWPTIDLKHIPHIKRHLDIKGPSAGSHTSSSSDSEEDTPKKQEQGRVQMPILPNRSPPKISHEHEIRRPAIPPEHPRSFKKSDSSSSSSSDSEDETHHKVQQSPGKLGIAQRPFQESSAKSPDPSAKWPTIDLKHIPHIKRRLDIKAPPAGSYISSCSDSEEDTTKYLKKQEQGHVHIPRQPTELPQTKSQYPKTQRPGIHFKHITSLSSSSSDSEDENRVHIEKQKLGSTGFPFQQSQTKSLDPDYTSSSSDEQKEAFKNYPVTVKPDSRSPEMGLSSTPYVKRRLDIEARSPKSSSSSDESEGRTTDLPVKVDSNLRSPISTLFNVPHSSSKDPNINLEKYAVITDDLEDRSSKDNISTTPEINSELQSRWATMNLGISRFRKRLEITSPRHQPSKLPLSPPPDSPLFSAESETGSITNQKKIVVGMQEITHTQTDSSLNLQNKPVKPSDSSSSSSSSSSEDEITENRVTPGMTYIDSPIAYKRSIIKTSSLPDNSFSPNSKSQINVAQESERDRSTSLAPKRVSSLSFEDTVRRKTEQRHNTDVDIPPEIRWTGVGHYLSNLSTPAPKTGLNAVSTSPQQTSPAKPEAPPLFSSSIKRDNKIKEDTWKSDLMPTHKLSSISTSSASSASGGALYRLYNSPNTTYEAPSTVLDDRKERRGLSALKAMSSERKKWDTEGFSEGDVHSQQADASLCYLKPDKRRTMDLLYGVPRYRSHDIKPPQAAPPPVPATLKPDEAVGLTWRSPQGSEKQGLEGNRSYQQQTQNTEEPGSPSLASEYPPIYLNTSNITHV